MSQELPIKFGKTTSFTIPKAGSFQPLTLDMSMLSTAEGRMHEARVVNMAVYSELEGVLSDGEKECRANHTLVGYEITKTKKAVRKIKSEYLLDEYPIFLKEKGLKDNACNREAFLARQDDYEEMLDRMDMLQAFQELLDGKIKVIDNVRRYMKKEVDIQLRSVFNNKYTS